jgi:hypothetical protein
MLPVSGSWTLHPGETAVNGYGMAAAAGRHVGITQVSRLGMVGC